MAMDVRFGYGVIQKWPDWVLLDKGERHEGIQPWIAAHYPEYDENGDVTSWGSGHYFDKLFDAVAFIESYIGNVNIVKFEESELDWMKSLVYDDLETCFSDGFIARLEYAKPVYHHCKRSIDLLRTLGDEDKTFVDYEECLGELAEKFGIKNLNEEQ